MHTPTTLTIGRRDLTVLCGKVAYDAAGLAEMGESLARVYDVGESAAEAESNYWTVKNFVTASWVYL